MKEEGGLRVVDRLFVAEGDGGVRGAHAKQGVECIVDGKGLLGGERVGTEGGGCVRGRV